MKCQYERCQQDAREVDWKQEICVPSSWLIIVRHSLRLDVLRPRRVDSSLFTIMADLSSNHRSTHIRMLGRPRPQEVTEGEEWRIFAGRISVVGPRPCLLASLHLSMSALRHFLRNLLQRKSIRQYGHIQEVQGVPFYEARPPWWAKLTWGIIAADLFMT